MKKVIAVVGMPGSGKGTCTEYLHDKYGWPLVHFGNMIYDEVQRRGLDNVKDEKFVREDMRKREGMDVFAKHVGRKAQEHIGQGQTIVVLDGLYGWGEYKHLLSVFGDDLLMIAVVAPKHVRRQRVIDRQDSHRKYTLQELVDREIAEIENSEKGGPIAYADYTIANDHHKEHLVERLENILRTEGII